ncbi:MAG: nucleotidyl transferase AbiEii/AbiGii toxin family protein [Balneolaceae bacterium]|nr:MAG: nucleotidyl transferase AbiEii/AbiGii toxin family protein [Balneolaceae bacterium]
MDSEDHGTKYEIMVDWLNIDDERKKLVYEQVAASENLPPIAVEKDFWVTLVLQSVFELEQAESFVFKGGTSLSKGWNLIQRFSEDVDLAVDRKAFGFDGNLGSSRRTKLRKAIREFVQEEFTPLLIDNLQKIGADVEVEIWKSENSDEDPSTIEIRFSSVTDPLKYLPPRVLVEVNARSLFEPYEERELTPLIGSVFAQLELDLIPAKILCVLPKRTFLEKVFLLHEEFQKNSDQMRAERLSRHLYDIESLMDTNHGKEALEDEELYLDIIHHRKHLTKISGIDYKKHLPGTIHLIPPEASIKQWQDDYKVMQESMIHGDSLSFDELMDRMKVLMGRINQLEFMGK